MIGCDNRVAYPFIRGLDLATVGKVTQLASYVVAGSFDDLDDDSVILGSEVARMIGATVGDKIEIYSPLLIEKLKHERSSFPGRSASPGSWRSATSSWTRARSTRPSAWRRTCTGWAPMSMGSTSA